MNKIFQCLLLLCLTIPTACKKEHKNTIGSTSVLHKVGFSVGFSQQTADFSTKGLKIKGLVTNAADTSITNHLDVLYFSIYDASANTVRMVTQHSTDNDFGSFIANLHTGTYTVIIAGGKTGLILGARGTGIPQKLSTDELSYGYYHQTDTYTDFNKDTFFKKIEITVTATDMTQHVDLDRITSLLVANVQDAMPIGARALVMKISGLSRSFNIGTAKAAIPRTATTIISVTVPATVAGTENFQISSFVLYTGPFSVDLICSSTPPPNYGEKAFLGEKIIPGVTGQPNSETLLTGNLFGGSGTTGGGGIKATIDTAWSSTQILKTFP